MRSFLDTVYKQFGVIPRFYDRSIIVYLSQDTAV